MHIVLKKKEGIDEQFEKTCHLRTPGNIHHGVLP